MAYDTDSLSRLIALCHDTLKASIPWQNYIKGNTTQSPHKHATAGGYVAAAIAYLANRPRDAYIASHVIFAHHSEIHGKLIPFKLPLPNKSQDLENYTLHNDSQVHAFITWIISELQGTVYRVITLKAILDTLHNKDFVSVLATIEATAITKDAGWDLFSDIRYYLGLLTQSDHASARRQSLSTGKELVTIKAQNQQATITIPGTFRTVRDYTSSGLLTPAQVALSCLRTKLKESVCQLVNTPGKVYGVYAATGTGKTEALLSAAEGLVRTGKARRIIYTLPLVAIMEQVARDYLSTPNISAIQYNYLVKATLNPTTATYDTLKVPHGFCALYNLTTMDQLAYALLDTHRLRCHLQAYLKDAVIILDEYHKLPGQSESLFLEALSKLAARSNSTIILASATPVIRPGVLTLTPDIQHEMLYSPVLDE